MCSSPERSRFAAYLVGQSSRVVAQLERLVRSLHGERVNGPRRRTVTADPPQEPLAIGTSVIAPRPNVLCALPRAAIFGVVVGRERAPATPEGEPAGVAAVVKDLEIKKRTR